MSEIQIFNVNDSRIRFGVADDGRPYSVAADYAKAMRYARTQNATDLLDEDEKGYAIVVTPGGPQQMAVIYEDGMWELIFRSTLPGAKVIKKQVKGILREIRETGSFNPPTVRLPDLGTPEGVLALAEQFTATARQLVESEARRRELEPKGVAYDQFLSADAGDRLVRQVAKLLGWKERDLRVFLLEEKLIFRRQALCGANQYDVYAAHAKHFKPVEEIVHHTWGDCAHYTLYVRPSGVELVQRRIARHRDVVTGA